MRINFLDKFFTLRTQKVLFSSFRIGFLTFNGINIFCYILFYLLKTKFDILNTSFVTFNSFYIIVLILLYLNIKYYNKIINTKINYITDCVNNGNNMFKCKYNFKSLYYNYEKNKTYNFENNDNVYVIVIHKNGIIDYLKIEFYINKFDFDSIKEKRKQKLKKLNNIW